jgi:leucyl/phenylalanyl-tRNA--protein transferase
MRPDLAPDKLLAAYAIGIFPMADDEGDVRWFAPDPRAVMELEVFKPSRSLRSTLQRGVFDVTVDRAFRQVIEACADRPEGTWISEEIKEAYCELHRLGFVHSVEAWKGGQLVGGLYGVTLGGAFFGESMFHHVPDASKVALARLIERLRERGYSVLDVQFMTEHLRRFGAVEIPRSEYEQRLAPAIRSPCSFVDPAGEPSDDTP